ncbi:MAG: hypothetical protein WCR51_08480 [Planctomycetia bacterium]
MGTDATPAGVPAGHATIAPGSLIGALLATALVLAGCREPKASVEGTVTFEGQPLRKGAIQFLPTDGNYRKAASVAVIDGRYGIPALMPGEKRVSVQGVKNESYGPEPQPLPENLEGNRATVVLRPGHNTFDVSLETKSAAAGPK